MRSRIGLLTLLLACVATIVAGCSGVSRSRGEYPQSDTKVNIAPVAIEAAGEESRDEWYHHLCTRPTSLSRREKIDEWNTSCTCPRGDEVTDATYYATKKAVRRKVRSTSWLFLKSDRTEHRTGVATSFYWHDNLLLLGDAPFEAAIRLTCKGSPPGGFIKRSWPDTPTPSDQ